MAVDYKSFNNGNQVVTPVDVSRKWWLMDNDTEMAQSIVGACTSLANGDASVKPSTRSVHGCTATATSWV